MVTQLTGANFSVLFFLISFWGCNFLQAHPVYVSMTEIVVISPDSLTIRVTVFSDDLQHAIQTSSASKEQSTLRSRQLIEKHVTIWMNEEAIPLSTMQCNIRLGETRSVLEYTGISPTDIQKITIQSDLFFNLFENQKNMIRLNILSQKELLLLSKETPRDSIPF